MNDLIQEAFFQVCDDAQPARTVTVSLYRVTPFYGGPEEGGWWGQDCELVAYRQFDTPEQAEAAEQRVQLLAKQLNAQAKRAYGEACLAQVEWLEQRGLDDDYLPQPDGEISYYVTIEDAPGGQAYRGSRHYE